jgi:hypothetical protein
MKKKAKARKLLPPPKKPKPASISPPNQSRIKDISDLFDILPVNARVELTRRYLPSLPGQRASRLS